MRFIVSVSLVLNGLLAGLIAGHLMAKAEPVACRCECQKAAEIDRGPFPTGWVVPEEAPAKPSGAAR